MYAAKPQSLFEDVSKIISAFRVMTIFIIFLHTSIFKHLQIGTQGRRGMFSDPSTFGKPAKLFFHLLTKKKKSYERFASMRRG